jgi:hypothetical protein
MLINIISWIGLFNHIAGIICKEDNQIGDILNISIVHCVIERVKASCRVPGTVVLQLERAE